MATEKEVERELIKSLREVGEITPWFDEEVCEWVFSHKLYPVEYGGSTPEEVIEGYPVYLREFILHRLRGKLDPIIARQTIGHGGKRTGAGRPRGSKCAPTTTVRLPTDVAYWIKQNKHLDQVRDLMAISN